MSREDRLRRLGDQTRALLDDLGGSRQDLLSVADLNRALHQVLRNQVAILESLTSGSSDPQAQTVAMPRPTTGNNGAPKITLRQKETVPAESEPTPQPELYDPTPMPDEADDPKNRDVTGIDPLEQTELAAMLGPLGGDPGQPSLASQVLGEERELARAQARAFVQEFDNRDNDYDKGLTKLNRWVSGGQAATPFQWRGNRAYLNINGAAPEGVRKYEQQLMQRMGFSRRLGRLVVPELQGEIVVYERP